MQGSLLQSLLSGRSAWLQARHAVLAQNIANADTPDYQPRDLKPENFEQLVARAGRRDTDIHLVRTDSRHIDAAGSRKPDGAGQAITGFETAPGGNSVILEEQADMMQQTQLDYQLTTNIYAKVVRLMKTAIGSGAS
ncbi:MAG: flagellar basal body rod protein FlgB [Geminicoccaceae bacterium]|nr:flagellar basal body rod protein FlgB [Geminicoccaceae bacterium]MCB9942353.1 flagellar basal body rod protein FlgB [Geminicoccaceae bacterium]